MQAGFRACKRCNPKIPGTVDSGVLAIRESVRHIAKIAFEQKRDDVDEPGAERRLEDLAGRAQLSTFHFHRTFKRIAHMTPGEFVQACDSLALQDMLGADQQSGSNGRVSGQAMKSTSKRWTPRTSRKALGGITPADYATGATATGIHYVMADSSFGVVCVAHSAESRSCCEVDDRCSFSVYPLALLLGVDGETRLKARFPAAQRCPGNSTWLQHHLKELEADQVDQGIYFTPAIMPVVTRARLWLRLVQDSASWSP